MGALFIELPGYFGRYVDPQFGLGGGRGAHSNFLIIRCIGLKLTRNTNWPMIYIIRN